MWPLRLMAGPWTMNHFWRVSFQVFTMSNCGMEEVLRRNKEVFHCTYFPAFYRLACWNVLLTSLTEHELLAQVLRYWSNFIWNHSYSVADLFWLFLMFLGFMFPGPHGKSWQNTLLYVNTKCLSQLPSALNFLFVVPLYVLLFFFIALK